MSVVLAGACLANGLPARQLRREGQVLLGEDQLIFTGNAQGVTLSAVVDFNDALAAEQQLAVDAGDRLGLQRDGRWSGGRLCLHGQLVCLI